MEVEHIGPKVEAAPIILEEEFPTIEQAYPANNDINMAADNASAGISQEVPQGQTF